MAPTKIYAAAVKNHRFSASFGENPRDRLRGGNHVDVVKLWGIYIQNKNIHNIIIYVHISSRVFVVLQYTHTHLRIHYTDYTYMHIHIYYQ